MNMIIRWYNQNRKQLFILVIIIASIISAIHFVNYLVKKDNEKNLNSGIISSSTSSTTTNYNPQQSAISSSSVSDSVYKSQSEVIDNFMKYCNEGNTKEAYDLLSNDCKEVVFPTLEYFIENYYKMIFKESKLYSIKNWTGNIYKINITPNILSTGKTNSGVSIQDYFTVVNEGKEVKLNINGFIERININKSNSNSNIEIEVLYKNQYIDYATYTLKAKNKTNKVILLDSGESTQDMYVMDSNNVKYTSYRNEIPNAELKVLPNSENKITIKYATTYIMKRQIDYLIFNDIILDNSTYENYILKGNYSDRASIRIEL